MEMHLCGLDNVMKKIKEKINNNKFSIEGATYDYYRF